MNTSRARLFGLWIAALVSGSGIALGGSDFTTRARCKPLSKQYVAFAENGCGLFRLNTNYSRGCGAVQAHAGKNFCLVGYSEAFASNGPGGGTAWSARKGGGWAGTPSDVAAPEDSVSTNLVEATVIFEPDRQVVTVNLALAALVATTNGAVSQIEVILWREDFDGDETLTPSKTLSYGSLVVKDGRVLAAGSLEGITLETSSMLLDGYPATAVQLVGQTLALPVAAGTDFDSLAVTIRGDGGHGETTPASNWTSPGYEWTPLTEAAPATRAFTGLAEDGVRGRIVLFGGRDAAGSVLNDTWEWIQPDGPWQQVSLGGLQPQPRQQHTMANLFGRRFHNVVFGGLDPAGAYLRDTWAWDGGAWQLLATNGPAHRAQAAMALDQPRQRVLLFGGLGGPNAPLGDTWSWNGTAWAELNVPGPSPRSGHAMAYNPFGQRIVLFGGEDATGLRHDTWEWDGSQWSLMSTSGPPARRDFAMARKDTRITLFGGRDAAGRLLGDTWEWNGTNWIKTADDCPTPRSGHAMSSDAFWGSPLLFGGADTGGTRDDAWRLHGVLFKRQPAGLSVDAGQPASFTVELTAGATTPTYQWERDCGDGFRPIQGATNSTHAIAATAAGDSCQYRCVVTVAGCLVASRAAPLDVRVVPAPPVITQQPRGGTLVPGETLTLDVAATGTGTLRYQWTQLGTPPLPRATNPVLVLGPVSAADAGQYVVEVRDDVDAVTSAPVTVVVVTSGGFFDDFEGYPSDADLLSGGGWHGWAEDPAAGGLVQTGRAFSPTRAVCVQGAGDLARRIAGVTGGQWVLTLRQFIPSSSAGTHYVNVLNRYRPPYSEPDLNWSVQIQCDTASGRVISDLGGGASLPLIKDEWIEIRCEIDLAANTVREFYHGELLAEHPWRGEGDLAIAALNLYAHGSGPACYDDVRLEPAEAPVITQEPESVTVNVGDSATFSVTATGAMPLTYQWHFNANPIADATQSALTISPVTLAHVGTYHVAVANAFGSVTSTPVALAQPQTLMPVEGHLTGSIYFCPPGKGSSASPATGPVQGFLFANGGFSGGGPIRAESTYEPPPFTGTRTGNGSITVSSAWFPTARYTIPVDTNPNTLNCGALWWPPGNQPATTRPFQYKLSQGIWMNLATLATTGTGHRYLFAVPPAPASIPVYPLGTSNSRVPFPNPPQLCTPELDVCECAALVWLEFEDCDGNPLMVSGGRFEGYADGSLQAFGNLPANSTTARFLVRGDVASYRVRLVVTAGTDPYLNVITQEMSRELGSTGCDVEQIYTVRFCPDECPDPPCPPCPFNDILGDVDMIGEAEHYFSPAAPPVAQHLTFSCNTITAVIADNGPMGNFRYSPQPGIAPVPSEAAFSLLNLPAGNYRLQSKLSFRVGNRFEYVESPYAREDVPCGPSPLDITDRFVMDPGYVKGDIKLCGPCVCDHLLQYLVRHDASDNNSDLLPDSWANLAGSSHVIGRGSSTVALGATHSAVGGLARALFEGAYDVDTCEFRGDYEMVLGGLNQEDSLWQANELALVFRNPGTPFLDESLIITDHQFATPQLIQGGQYRTNDHNYCFGEVTLRLKSSTPFFNPSVSGSGVSQPTDTDCDGNPVSYLVSVSARGTPLSLGTTTTGEIRMVLPAGTYTLTPSVQVAVGNYTFQDVTFMVKCGECIVVNPDIQLTVDDLPSCINSLPLPISGTVTAASGVANITYAFNGGTPSVGCTGPGCTTFAFNATATVLPQGLNTVTIEATDNLGNKSSRTKSFTYDSVPPVISGCNDVHVTVPAGQTGANVSWPPITATDNSFGPVLVTTSHASGSVFPLGVTVVTATAVDACGNVSTCQFKVTVQDCVGIIGVSAVCGPTSDYLVTFTYENPGPDPVTWLMLSPLSSCASVTPTSFHFPTPIPPGGKALLQMNVNLPPGCPTRLCFQATALNAAREECCSVERCIDLIGINCPEDIIVDCQDERGAWVEWDPIAISFGGLGLPVICSHSPGWFPIGVTRVTCTFVDECDRQRTCEFTVCVRANGPGVWSRARNDEAQSPATNASQGLGIATDLLGNVVYAGSFHRQIRITGALTLNAVGQRDGYLVKEDPAGTVLWAVKMGTSGDDEARSVVTDDAGNIYVTGHVDGSLQVIFDSWPAIPNTGSGVSGKQQDIFVACYNPGGALQWFRRLGDNGNDAGIDIAINPQGDPIAVGQWTVNGSPEAFVTRLNRHTGTTVGSIPILRTSGGPGRAAAARGVTVDGLGNVYIVGNHAGPTSFPPLSGPLPSGGFVAKADPTLSGWLWARETYGNADLRAVALDTTSGDLFLTGYFNGMVRLDKPGGGQLSLFNTKSGSLYDYLIARLEPAGGLATWLIKGGGSPTAAEETRDLAMDDLGNSYVTGFLHANAPSPWVGTGQRVLVASYDGNGHLRWTRHPDGGSSSAQAGHSLAVDCARCVYVTGEFAPRLDFPNPSFAPSLPGIAVTSVPVPVGQTWTGRICPVCPCQDTEVTRFDDKNISTGWDNTANGWTPPGSNDDEWVWVDTGTGNTHPAIIAGPPGSPPAAPISIFSGHPFRLRYCLGLPAGCLAERIGITVASANPDPAGIKVYFNSQLIGSGPGTPGFSAIITSGFISNNDCLEIEVNQDYPVAVSATVSATCGCGTVSGIKFDDRNRDGIKGTSEAGLANWLITFTDHTGNVIGSSLTGINGTYQSGPMFAGTYAVCEVQQGGWLPSAPSGGCHAGILLAPGGAVSGVDIGNYPVGSIRWTGGTGGTLMIIWDGNGTLHAAPNVAGPYEPVSGATSPFPVPTGDAPMRYFRVTWP